MSSLKGRVAVVTGASRGIGYATALRLSETGASVYVAADGTREELESATAECQRRGAAGSQWGIFDLSRPGAAEAMVEAALRAFGRVDILVNNAGVRCRKPFGSFTPEDFETVVAVNLRAPFFASQAVLPAMRRAGGGRIINVASQLGSVAFQDYALYGLTKAALVYLTRAMAFELARENVWVNAVSPGPIETRYTTDRLADKPDLRRKMEGYVPMGRFGDPDEVAEVIVFLASCRGGYIQGHNLLVDGGYVIH